MNAGQWIVVACGSIAIAIAVVVALRIATQDIRTEAQVRADRLRLAALRSQFEQDHPDRVRVGVTEEEK